MKSLGVRRCLAFLLDYALIALYAGLLFLVIRAGSDVIKTWIGESPVRAQMIGFALLTVPVLLYFILTESSSHRGSIGKRLMNLRIVLPGDRAYRVLIRNVVKFLPWEVAHTGIYQSLYADTSVNPATSTILLLTVPQVVVIAYILSIFASKGRVSWYDSLAGTSVTFRNEKKLN